MYFGERSEARDLHHEARLRAESRGDEWTELERFGSATRVRQEALAALTAARTGPGEPLSVEALEALTRYARLLAESRVEDSESLMARASARYTVEDWRRIAGVDADSIREERRLRAEVLRLAGELDTRHGR
jgi:hypothetical protein